MPGKHRRFPTHGVHADALFHIALIDRVAIHRLIYDTAYGAAAGAISSLNDQAAAEYAQAIADSDDEAPAEAEAESLPDPSDAIMVSPEDAKVIASSAAAASADFFGQSALFGECYVATLCLHHLLTQRGPTQAKLQLPCLSRSSLMHRPSMRLPLPTTRQSSLKLAICKLQRTRLQLHRSSTSSDAPRHRPAFQAWTKARSCS